MADDAEERLYYAIDSSDTGVISRLLREGLSVNTVFSSVSRGRSVWSALHLCCEKGRLECARVLLEAKACVDITDKWNLSPLMYAVIAEWTELIELLLQYGADVDAQDGWGLTSLHLSVRCHDVTCLSLLAAKGAGLETRDVFGRTALWQASVGDGHLMPLNKLLALGADVEAMDTKDKFTPLHAALWYAGVDREAYVEALLQAGATPNHQVEAHSEVTPRRPSALMTLLQRTWKLGSDVTKEEERLALSLLAFGCDVDVSVTSASQMSWHHSQCGTVLKMAAHRGAPTMVALLLEAGAAPDIQDADGLTALHMAVLYNHLACVQLLLTAQCRLDLTACVTAFPGTPPAVTAFRCALLSGHLHAAQLMVHAGYDLRHEHYLWTSRHTGGPAKNFGGPSTGTRPRPTGEDITRALAVKLGKTAHSACRENGEFWNWVVRSVSTMHTEPLDLMCLCRRVIRDRMHLYNPRFITDSLPLPSLLREYLSLTGHLGRVS